MGNYRQHITFAAVLGVVYGWATFLLAGIPWLYGSVAALLTTLSGLLPDLDSDSGVEMKGFTGILGVLVAVAVWQELARVDPPPGFELHLWAVVGAYLAVRHGLRSFLGRLTVHRGISHSLPTCAVWGALAYLYYPNQEHLVRLMMAVAVMTGFFSHLLLDEICSVDLQGVRVNRAFGTAMKFWSPSPWTTVAMYSFLSYLTWRIVQIWPDGPFVLDPPSSPSFPSALLKNLSLQNLSVPDWARVLRR